MRILDKKEERLAAQRIVDGIDAILRDSKEDKLKIIRTDVPIMLSIAYSKTGGNENLVRLVKEGVTEKLLNVDPKKNEQK